MGVPDWNRVGSQEPALSTDGNQLYLRDLEDIENRTVRITTLHEGTVSYSENGYTNLDMSHVLDYAVEMQYLGLHDRLAGNLPSDNVLREWAQEMFEEEWDIEQFDNFETGDNSEEESSYIEDVEIY